MKTLAIAFVLLAAVTARAEPVKLTAIHCTLDGAALTVGEVSDGLAVAPDGAVLVIDGGGNLRRYVRGKGKGCALHLDRVIALGAGDDFVTARLDVDHDGTIYAMVGGKVLRIANGKRAPICGEGLVAASPDSDRVWRWLALTAVTRQDAACTVQAKVDASNGDDFLGSVWAVGDGIVVQRGRHVFVFDGDGKPEGELDGRDDFVRVTACGDSICAARLEGITVWGGDHKQTAAAEFDELLGTHESWIVHGFATRGGSAYVLGVEHTEQDPDGHPVIVRVDGLPR
jgi:hypothetical protein